mmetsp:Transcript_15517/g.49697  ORF Transcript_15517/g.49697 Transcript_15517/m.49697 type:complete len:303 (+) Transcript_15517:1125-2033(+)
MPRRRSPVRNPCASGQPGDGTATFSKRARSLDQVVRELLRGSLPCCMRSARPSGLELDTTARRRRRARAKPKARPRFLLSSTFAAPELVGWATRPVPSTSTAASKGICCRARRRSVAGERPSVSTGPRPFADAQRSRRGTSSTEGAAAVATETTRRSCAAAPSGAASAASRLIMKAGSSQPHKRAGSNSLSSCWSLSHTSACAPRRATGGADLAGALADAAAARPPEELLLEEPPQGGNSCARVCWTRCSGSSKRGAKSCVSGAMGTSPPALVKPQATALRAARAPGAAKADRALSKSSSVT